MYRWLPIILLSSLSFASPAGTDLADKRLSMQGLGPFRIGMSQTQFDRLGFALQHKFPPSGDRDSLGCYQAALIGHPDVGLMFEDGILTRIEILSGEISSLSGIGIGSTETQARTTYGKRLTVEPHFYAPEPYHYLKLFSSDGRRAMVFETDGDRVDEFRAGETESAQYVEGCL